MTLTKLLLPKKVQTMSNNKGRLLNKEQKIYRNSKYFIFLYEPNFKIFHNFWQFIPYGLVYIMSKLCFSFNRVSNSQEAPVHLFIKLSNYLIIVSSGMLIHWRPSKDRHCRSCICMFHYDSKLYKCTVITNLVVGSNILLSFSIVWSPYSGKGHIQNYFL